MAGKGLQYKIKNRIISESWRHCSTKIRAHLEEEVGSEFCKNGKKWQKNGVFLTNSAPFSPIWPILTIFGVFLTIDSKNTILPGIREIDLFRVFSKNK